MAQTINYLILRGRLRRGCLEHDVQAMWDLAGSLVTISANEQVTRALLMEPIIMFACWLFMTSTMSVHQMSQFTGLCAVLGFPGNAWETVIPRRLMLNDNQDPSKSGTSSSKKAISTLHAAMLFS